MRSSRRGVTLVELALALVVLGIVAAVAVPRGAALVDSFGVRGATQDVVLGLAAARAAATRRGDYTTFVANPRDGRVAVLCAGDTVFGRDLARSRGVRLQATRESVTFAPTGLGWGAATPRSWSAAARAPTRSSPPASDEYG